MMAETAAPAGENKTPRNRLRDIWYGMIARCHDVEDARYARYGARGITVCPEWHDYDVFRGWSLANGYDNTLTIDRRDNSKGYGPDNCRWATMEEQANNRSNNRRITYAGTTLTHSEWARVIGVSPQAIYAAIRRGIDGAEYIRQHLDEGHGRKVCCSSDKATITVAGETHSVRRWAEIIGVSPGIVYRTIREGKDPVEYIQTHLDAGWGRRVYGDSSLPIATRSAAR